MSARVLGLDLGMTAQQVNALLKERGLLDGEPGAYCVTEKGLPFVHERDEHRGPGGYAFYNRDWTVRTWKDEVRDVLAADTATAEAAADPDAGVVDTLEIPQAGDGDMPPDDVGVVGGSDSGATHRRPEARTVAIWLAVGGAVVAAGVVVAPPAKRLWHDRLEPRVRRLRRRATTDDPADAVEEPSPTEQGSP